MIYSDFKGQKLSLLGFGAMRLPVADGKVDEPQVIEMTRRAIQGGVNYFDTAFPYHNGESERVMGRALSAYPRDSFYLATKFPGHQIAERHEPAPVFEEQLKKCGVDYFDFYLLHNVCENSLSTYQDERWGIIPYFLEQKKRGRIRHLGFSSHGDVELLRDFLDQYGADMEFCQIQLNYLDWTLQRAKEKYDLLTARGIPVWVMEPVRGGKLAKLNAADEQTLHALRPNASIPSFGFRFLQGLPNVQMVLSGMSDMAQMEDNLKTFQAREPLSKAETDALFAIAEGMKNEVPCTGCRYCVAGCPLGLNIPMLLSTLNDLRFSPAFTGIMRLEALPKEKQPGACIACGQCAAQCPQGIDVPARMQELDELVRSVPSWAEICRQRDLAQQGKKA